MTYNDNDVEPDPSDFDPKFQKSAIETLELVLKLSNQNAAEQVIAAQKFAYFPFSSFCMNIGDEEGAKLQHDYQKWFNEARKYVRKHGGLGQAVPVPVPTDPTIPVPDPKDSETPPPE